MQDYFSRSGWALESNFLPALSRAARGVKDAQNFNHSAPDSIGNEIAGPRYQQFSCTGDSSRTPDGRVRRQKRYRFGDALGY